MSDQWIRKASLLVFSGATNEGLDLSQLQFKFKVRQGDIQSPNNATIRIYNLSEATSKRIQNEFTRVILSAGYQTGNYGTIFSGSVVQLRKGKENATDKYLDLLAADGDMPYNFAVMRQSFAAGSAAHDHIKAAVQAMAAMSQEDIVQGYVSGVESAPKLPRGKVVYGMARDVLRDVSKNLGAQWSIQNGAVQVVPTTSYLPNDIVRLTSQTGILGIPEQTVDGINIKCLLNPQLRVAGRVQIDNAAINQTQSASAEGFFTAFDKLKGVNYLAPTNSTDGVYRILVVDHQGDTRGNDWSSELVCVSVDATLPPSQALRGRV